MNKNDNIFIYPSNLKNKLPQKVINCIKPSMKYIHNFTIDQLKYFNDKFENSQPFFVSPMINTDTIKNISTSSKILTINNKKIKNHFISDDNINNDILQLLSKNPVLNNNDGNNNNYDNIPNNFPFLIQKCGIKLLQKYEKEFKIKYKIIDKKLGIAILDEVVYDNIKKKEMNNILIQINYEHNPQLIKRIAINFAYEHQNVMNSFNQIPNKTLTILVNDIKRAKNGYFQINPLYKAHKYKQKSVFSPKIHTPKIRPVISGINSPLIPILKIMADACTIIIHKLLDDYDTINIALDSFHVINIINEYIKYNFHPTDVFITFDFESFYTELPYNFIQNKLTNIYNIFMNKYKTSNYDYYKKYANIILLIQNGYKLASKYCIIEINDIYFKQKQGVIMGASFAPSLANLVILIHNIECEMFKNKLIKVNIRQIDDTLMICSNMMKDEVIKIFQRYNPKILKFTTELMINDKLKFLDILFIKIKDNIEYCMQIKSLKTEFFVPYTSNHPMHIKINIITNMIKRATILCSNYILFHHTMIALRLRFAKSGYPTNFLDKYMDESIYNCRNEMFEKLNNNRKQKTYEILNMFKLNYKSMFNDNVIQIPYNNFQKRNIKSILNELYPDKFFVFKLNSSIQRIIRTKNTNN